MLDTASPPLSWPARVLLRSGGVGALGALIVFVCSFISMLAIRNQQLSEIVIVAVVLVAPLALLPTVAAVYWIYRSRVPKLSRKLLVLAGLGLTAILLMPVLGRLFNLTSVPARVLYSPLVLWSTLMLCNGVWPILMSVAAVRYDQPALVSVAIGGALAGSTWLVCGGSMIAISLIPALWGSLAVLMIISAMLFVPAACIWLAGTSYWLLTYPSHSARATVLDRLS